MARGDAPAIDRIGQISVNVRDLGRAVAFYRDVLGLTFLFEAGGRMAFFDCGGVRLMLGVAESPEFDHPASTIYYRVPDIHAAWRALRERGVEPAGEGGAGEPHRVYALGGVEGWMCFFRDTEGNLVALMSEVPAGAAGR